jgi:hypothetical protein
MRKADTSPRFGPEHWVTLRETGEHVKVEAWSKIAAVYRVHSRKHGMLFVTDEQLDEVPVHPDVLLGKHWTSCQAPRCGAPLTPGLPICARCGAPICSCGRCQCAPARGVTSRAKTAGKKAALRAR